MSLPSNTSSGSGASLSATQWFAEELQPREFALRRWLRARFTNEADVDDLVQETYMRLLRGAERPVRSPRALLFTTARNLAVDRMRRQHVAREAGLVDGPSPEVVDDRQDVAEATARNQERALLAAAIEALPARCREVFRLRRLQGWSQAEIAARLGVSECTVSAQLSIGLRKCTEYIQRQINGDTSP